MNYSYKRKAISPKLRQTIFEKAVYKSKAYCAYCPSGIPTEIDHIIPVSRGGTNDENNLVACCYKCNRWKNIMLLEEFGPGVAPVPPSEWYELEQAYKDPEDYFWGDWGFKE